MTVQLCSPPLFQSHPGGRIVHIMSGYFGEGSWLNFGNTFPAFWHNIAFADQITVKQLPEILRVSKFNDYLEHPHPVPFP